MHRKFRKRARVCTLITLLTNFEALFRPSTLKLIIFSTHSNVSKCACRIFYLSIFKVESNPPPLRVFPFT